MALSPEEEARIAAYWGADASGSAGGVPPPPPMPSAAPVDSSASAGGIGAPIPPPAPIASAPQPMMSAAPPPEEMMSQQLTPDDEAKLANYFGGGVDKLASFLSPPNASQPTPPAAPATTLPAVTVTGSPTRAAGAGAKPNPDPYGIHAAQQGQLDALGQRSDALTRAANADAVKATQIAEGTRDLARFQEEDAAIARQEGELAQRHFDEGMQEIGRQLDDVRAKKIDPLKMFKESPALGVLSVIGGALGGFYQGITGGQTNEFLADLDRQIDRGIAEDQRQIDTDKFALGEATNLLATARAANKDKAVAELQYRNMAYEAAKQQIAAQAASDDVPAARARADESIAQITLAQQQLAEQIGTAKQRQALAAASAGTAQAKEVRDFRLKVYETMIKEGFAPAQAEVESRRQVAIQYLGGAGPRPAGESAERPAMTREQRGKLAAEHGEAQHSSDEFNEQVDDMLKSPMLKQLGLGTSALSHLGQRAAPESASVDQARQEMNTQVLQAIGKVAKDADGKPNKVMIEKLEERFEIHLTDTEAMARQKLEGARSVVNALARQQGAEGAPKPGHSKNLDVSKELGAKPM